MKTTITLLSLVFAVSSSAHTLDTILAGHECEKEIVLQPLDAKYDAELAKLLQRLTAAGKFKESVEVDNLIKERRGVVSILSGVGTWIWPDGKKLVLSSDGKATFSAWSGEGTWKEVDSQTVEVTNPEGKPGILKMLPDGKVTYVSGANNKGSFFITKQNQ
jgi:myo-inositol-hexaphosphate 3-phosphohydrolase